MRIDRDEMWLQMADVASHRSTCNRLHVGSILVKDNRPISIGYNGVPSGVPHCGHECNEDNPCYKTIHAEVNTILKALQGGLNDWNNTTLYVTHSPCLNCASVIISSGVKRVVFRERYRDQGGITYLTQNGVLVNEKM